MTDPAEEIVSIYRRHARAWAARRASGVATGRPPMEEAWLDRFLAPLVPGAAILDIGCGPGEPLARRIAERGFVVTGVDSSPEMIALFRQRLPAAPVHLADMRALALGRRFDGLLAWDSFFHLGYDDQRRMFPVFRAHAAPGAMLMFTSGPDHGTAIGELEGEPLHHASLDGAEYRALLAAAGFDVVAHAAEDPTCGGHTVWLARRA
jgi:2-polyprenyl-3-methyl-5-hydroxy-6-metoxy-1,4-benzoquinol methylase